MELSELRSFLAVHRSGGFTRAAERLHLSQPAVSGHIKRLEQQLGVELLQRSPHGLRLTAEGEMMLPLVRDMLSLEVQLKQVAADLRQVERGQVKLACGVTHAATRLPQVMRAYAQRHPGVEVKLQAAASKEAVKRLLWGEADVALVTTLVDESKIKAAPLFADRFVAVGPPETAGWNCIEGLVSLGLVTFPAGTGLRRFVDNWMVSQGLTEAPSRITEIESLEAARSLAQAGMGITLLPEAAVDQLVEDGYLALLPVQGTPLQRTTYLCTPRDRYMTHAARNFIKFISGFFSGPLGQSGQEGEEEGRL